MQLDGLPTIQLRGLSRWYKTEPVPPSAQTPYINAVAQLAVAAGALGPDPAKLLLWLQAIETRGGRVRGERNAARTLDLDIVAMGMHGRTVRAAPDPVLPHPRAHQRAFVLAPLLDVAPNWMHPVLCRPARELLAALPLQGIELLDPIHATPVNQPGDR